MLIIDNLEKLKELECNEMIAIRGGFDPFAYAGLSSMMDDVLGRLSADPPFTKTERQPLLGVEEGLRIVDYNYTEVTSES